MSKKSKKPFSPVIPITIGLLSVFLLVGGFVAWGVMANIAGAVVASGRIVVDKNRQAVQHPDGGVVEDILVEEGDLVREGDILVRLDPTLLRSSLHIVEGQLFELIARRGRLEAERDGLDKITFDPVLLQFAETQPDIAAVSAGQQRLFDARNASQKKQIEQLRNRQTQLENQVRGIEVQMEALKQQQLLIKSELKDQNTLLEKGLAQVSRVLTLQREEARLAGALGSLVAQKAQSRDRIAEIEIEELSLATTRRENAITRLRDLQFNELELAEQRRSLQERLSRLDIRAPISGVVYNLQVSGRRSVVRAAEEVLYLIPQDRPLVIEAQVDTIHVDQVYQTQEVVMRVSAFDLRNTPDLYGSVTHVSPDAFSDPQTGASWYRVEIELPEEELSKLNDDQVLIPGMPVDSFIRTQDRTPAAYLMAPLSSYFEKAFRDG